MSQAARQQCRVTFNRQRHKMTLTKHKMCLCVGEFSTRASALDLEVVCVISVFCLINSPAFGKKRKKEQVTDTYHQQPSIYTLRLLACHSISHSVDYTPRGAWGENHSGNPILCHIKCQNRSFRFSVISTETAGAKLGEHAVEVEEGGRDEGFSTGERERGWRMSWRYVRKPYWPSGPTLYATMGRS